jgi:hypothetical protein
LPTYQEFRTWALAHGYTGRALAPHVQASDPVKTATRILVFLNDTHWDHEPLPYPKLCALYEGATDEPPAPKPAKPVSTVGDFVPVKRSTHHVWLALFDAGWSCAKIASAWSTLRAPVSAEDVAVILNDLSMEPTPAVRPVPPLPKNTQAHLKQRNTIARLYRVGWTIDRLYRTFFYLSPEVIRQTVGSPVRKSRAKLSPRRKCPCGCAQRVTGRRTFATESCRKKVARRESMTERPV